MDRVELAQAINEICRLEGRFVLRSGRVATEYFDKYLFESDPAILREVAEHMVTLLPKDTEVVGGLELGGVPLATAVSLLTGLPAVFVRKEAKTYGTCQLAEGRPVAGAVVTLIEDVITTGGAVRAAADALRDRSATISTVVCAIDRSGPDEGQLEAANVAVRSVLTLADLDQAHTL